MCDELSMEELDAISGGHLSKGTRLMLNKRGRNAKQNGTTLEDFLKTLEGNAEQQEYIAQRWNRW